MKTTTKTTDKDISVMSEIYSREIDRLLEENTVLKAAYKGAASVVSRLGEENKRLKKALSHLIQTAASTTKNLVAFDGANELDESIDKAQQALNNNINLQK